MFWRAKTSNLIEILKACDLTINKIFALDNPSAMTELKSSCKEQSGATHPQ